MAKSSKKQDRTSRRSRRRGETPQAVRQTKKQIALGRKQARQNRIIWLSVTALGMSILIILGVGLLREFVLQPSRPVALLTNRRYNLHLDIGNLQNSLQSMDPSDETNQLLINFYQQQLEQLQSSLAVISESVLDELIDDALIREKAEELEITATADEVEETINEDIRQAVTLPSQQLITDTEQLPTPTPIPQEQLDEFYQNALDNMGLSNKEFRTIVQRNLLRSKVQDHLASLVPTTGLVVHVQMIQTDTEEEALAARQRVESGEDFATVAKEVSTSSEAAETGGDMDWVASGQLASRYGEDLDTYVFSLAVGEIGQVQSNETYYVVQVLERDENGPLPDQVLSPKQSSALQDWLTERKGSPEARIERLLEPDQIPPDPFAQSLGF
jgi:parvulin-like peptidyl-prolyl isomerase